MPYLRKNLRLAIQFSFCLFCCMLYQFKLKGQDCQQHAIDEINKRGSGIPENIISFYEPCINSIEKDYFNGRKQNIDNLAFSEDEMSIKTNILKLKADSTANQKQLSSLKQAKKTDSITNAQKKINKQLNEQYKLLDRVLDSYKSTLLTSFTNLVTYWDNRDKDEKAKQYKERIQALKK